MANGTMPKNRAEAKAQGAKRFFTGDSCKRGHVAERKACDGTCVECAKMLDLKWKAENPARFKETSKKAAARWYASHIEHARAVARKRVANDRELARAKCKKWRADNPIKARIDWDRRRVRKLSAEGSYTVAEADRIRAAQKDKCAACGTRLKGGGHLDHIVALARGGSNWPSNLQWLCAPCNLTKSARDPIEFMQSRGKLL